jgi:hypothetical protein
MPAFVARPGVVPAPAVAAAGLRPTRFDVVGSLFKGRPDPPRTPSADRSSFRVLRLDRSVEAQY